MGIRRGCFQCTKRRIVCDMGEPHCAKCTGRGLECSGNGLRIRFNDGVASRGKLKGQSKPVIAPSALPACKAAKRSQPRSRRMQLSPSPGHASERSSSEEINNDDLQSLLSAHIQPCLESHESNTRLLFDHCTSPPHSSSLPCIC